MNYKDPETETEDEESFISVASSTSAPVTPLSPSNPRFGDQTSPPPTRQVLQDVANNLRVVEAIQNVEPNWPALSEVCGEEVIEGRVDEVPVEDPVVEAENEVAAVNNIAVMPDAPKYDMATGDDAADVYTKLSTLKTPFDKDDAKFWFANFERTIKHFGVKSQVTKKEALINQLTKEAVDECKSLISLDEDEQGETPYHTLKVELLKLYAPRPEDCYAKAASRVLVGKPSTLCKQIVNDFCECPKPLQCKCCAKIASGMWVKNLPTYVKAHISNEPFDHNTYKQVLEKADKCWLSHRGDTPQVSAIKAENAAALAGSDDLENPAVAAMRKQSPRGARGGRGNGYNRGNQRGGNHRGNNRGGGRGGGGRGGNRKPQGPKHPTAVDGSCYIHHQFGNEAWSCADRHNCPMRDIENPKPSHNRNIPIEK